MSITFAPWTSHSSVGSAQEYGPLVSRTLPEPRRTPQETFVFNSTTGLLVRLSVDDEGLPQLLGSVVLTAGERVLFLALFTAYPEYAAFDELLAAYHYHSLDEEAIVRGRRQLQTARKWQEEFLPVRALLTRTRFKVRQLGLEIVSITEAGYLLQPVGLSYIASMKTQPQETLNLNARLRGLVPKGHVLAYNPEIRSLCSLGLTAQGSPQLLFDTELTLKEERILVPLFELYPQYCPDAVVVASFTYGTLSEQAVYNAHVRLQDAFALGAWDAQMRPIRNIVSRVRGKIAPTGIGITSILGTGYMLISLGTQEKGRLSYE